MKRKLSYLFVILSPLLAGFILALFTGTSIFKLDAWNTNMNDEVGYYRSVKTMKEIGLPAGNIGYNEVEAKYPAYGAYNYVTYLPYFFVSFITGSLSHNYIVYINLLLAVLSNLFVVCLLKPTFREGLSIVIFTVTHMLITRYVWSGMSEESTIFLTVVVAACSVWQFRNLKSDSVIMERTVLIIQLLAIFIGTLIRPYMLAYVFFTILYVCKASANLQRIMRLVFILVLSLGGIFLYFWMAENICVQFFSANNLTDLIILLKEKDLFGLFSKVITYNGDACKIIWDKVLLCDWVGIIMLEVCVLVLIALFFCLKYRKDNREAAAYFLIYGIIVFLTYEAVTVLYSAVQLHRMMLGCIVAGVFLYIFILPWKPMAIHELYLLCMLAFAQYTGGVFAGLSLPQKNEDICGDKDMEEKLASLMPRENDMWGNTLALPPLFSDADMSILFAMPLHIALNTCTTDYLYQAIETDTLKSRYVLSSMDNTELIRLCQESYELIYNKDGYCIFERMAE